MEDLRSPFVSPRSFPSMAIRKMVLASLLIVLSLLASYYPSASAQTISSAHPRLWLTPQRLTRLKASAGRNTPRWQNVLSAADSALNSGGDVNPDDIPPLALVYQVTGNTSYANKAIQITLANATSANDLTGDDCYPYRTVMPDVAAGLDWCYNQMTTAQRHQVATWLMDRADYIWPETNPSRAGAWGLWPSNNYYWGFLMSWPAAIAASGDDTKSGSISGSNRPQFHLNLALKKWNNDVLPWATTWGVGGMFAESTNYDSTHRLAMILDGNLTGTGQDLINAPGFSYLHDSVLWRIHSTVPTRDLYYPLGDQPRVSLGPLSDYDRQRAYQASADLNDSTMKGYAKSWLDTISPNIGQWSFTSAWEFLYYDDTASSTDYTTALPPYYFASGPGILLGRSDWSQSATYFGIWAGPLLESHQDCDVNGFQIYKGGWLAGNAAIWSSSGELEATVYHNNLTFGGAGQSLQDGSATGNQPGIFGGYTIKQENTSEYNYFAGWGAQAYAGSHNPGVTDYVRKFVFISPSTFLVYDRATLSNAGTTKEWHIHSQTPITVSGRNYTFNNGQYRLFGQALLPTSGVSLQSTQDSGGSSYRLDANTNNNRATDYILNTMELTPMSQASVPPPTAIAASAGSMEGAQVGNWIVMFGKSEQISGSVSYSINGAAATQHLVLDLMPNSNYTLSAGSTSGTVSTSSKGSLRFSVAAGNSQVTLTPGSGQPTVNLASVSVNPSSVTGGASATGTVTLSSAAPSGGAVVTLSSNIAAATVPANITVAAGSATATFSVTTKSVASNASATLSGAYNGTSKTTALTITTATGPANLGSISVSPNSVTGGSSSTGTVNLTGAAPAGGAVITLSSGSTAATVLSSITVAAGAASATFAVATTTVTSNTNVTITGSYNGTTKTAALAITNSTPPTTMSIWSNASPANPSVSDPQAAELGVKFKSDVSGHIRGIRFYKGTNNTGIHTGSLWSSGGALLAKATFTQETASGWQQVMFATPVAITAGKVYVASYHTSAGNYAGDNNYFASSGTDNAPLHALKDGVSGRNGLYKYGSGFPTSSYLSSNYWVDVVFSTP